MMEAVEEIRQFCIETAARLKPSDGESMTLKELLGKAEEIYKFITEK